MSFTSTLCFILTHPLTAGSKADALGRFVGWQLRSRVFPGPRIVPFVNGARLAIRRGRPGSTANLYTRLHEFPEMGFVLHSLREGDLFVDVGANIGAYSILAASLGGTRCIAFEPASDTYALLLENIAINGYEAVVTPHRVAIGSERGEVALTSFLDTVNHVASDVDGGVARETVPLETLDGALAGRRATVIKIDVEGYETLVIDGARETLGAEGLLALVVEMNGSGSRYGFDEPALANRFLAQGFEAFSYDPFERRLQPFSENNASGNRIYVRDRDAMQKRLSSARPFALTGGLRI